MKTFKQFQEEMGINPDPEVDQVVRRVAEETVDAYMRRLGRHGEFGFDNIYHAARGMRDELVQALTDKLMEMDVERIISTAARAVLPSHVRSLWKQQGISRKWYKSPSKPKPAAKPDVKPDGHDADAGLF